MKKMHKTCHNCKANEPFTRTFCSLNYRRKDIAKTSAIDFWIPDEPCEKPLSTKKFVQILIQDEMNDKNQTNESEPDCGSCFPESLYILANPNGGDVHDSARLTETEAIRRNRVSRNQNSDLRWIKQ